MTDGAGPLLELSAALASRREDAVRVALAAARETDPVAVEEALLQSYLFLGYPAALNAFALWREISGRPADPASTHHPGAWAERGAAVCGRVYGGAYRALRDNVRALHPDLERWMVEEGYGKVLGRPGLSLPVRELCVVAVLAVQDVPRQLHSHLRGALNAGASPEAVERALRTAAPFQPPELRERCGRIWEEVRARWEGRGAGD